MFEKEAEEYYEDVTVGIFQECKENFADAVLTAYREGAEFGYNKANEWHYPSKGELPDVMQEVIICLKDEKIITRAIRINSDLWTSPTNDYFSREIIAWKEIVLPELKESKSI